MILCLETRYLKHLILNLMHPLMVFISMSLQEDSPQKVMTPLIEFGWIGIITVLERTIMKK
ncbi:hypothetical protein C477_08118 [Haloterrigena salina JCM 13891]|uniref:Uncharacterized protein n=1 Tax=Haloterrigena salina JCM 13891 TaxID=1227488 RepID=M0C8R6_9EURY|nr:hypothetical protein C477_08118 [Haloterrigena salina JCM 13891]